MEISAQLTDDALLGELGKRLAQRRIELDLTQAKLSEEAGISKRTLERLEAGAVATQMSVFLRVCRALGVLDRLELFLPEPQPGPMAQLKQQSRRRQRASGKRSAGSEPWTWGETP